jgi:hypothetical protein
MLSTKEYDVMLRRQRVPRIAQAFGRLALPFKKDASPQNLKLLHNYLPHLPHHRQQEPKLQ